MATNEEIRGNYIFKEQKEDTIYGVIIKGINAIQNLTRQDERDKCDAEKEQAVKSERERVINEIEKWAKDYKYELNGLSMFKYALYTRLLDKLNQLKQNG